jgi:uncharacterized protein (DUF2267 family)
MQYDDFLALVQEHAGLNSRTRALDITRATLETLAERIDADTADNVASQLPPGIARFLRNRTGGAGERFPVDEFVRRVADRADIESDEAIRELRIVLQSLTEAVTEGQVNHLWAELPGEYLSLFEPTRNSGRAGAIRAEGTV